jgi:hypothetical protein
MTTLFFLVLTFYSGSYGGTSSMLVTQPYASVQQCDDAGRAAKKHYSGGAIVDWTCVPTGSTS